MKLSSHTTSVLKNFATINQNLVIKEGNTIATMSAMKNIVAKAEVEENFPQEVAIYDELCSVKFILTVVFSISGVYIRP